MTDKEPKYYVTFKDGKVVDSKGLNGKRVGVGRYNIWGTDEPPDLTKVGIECFSAKCHKWPSNKKT